MMLALFIVIATISVLIEVVTGAPDHLKARQQNAQKEFINASVANAAEVVLHVTTNSTDRNDTGT